MKLNLSNVLLVLVATGIISPLRASSELNLKFGNEQGKNASLIAEEAIQDSLQLFYSWQDQINFETEEMVRNIIRFGREFVVNLDQFEKLISRFVKVIKKKDSENLINEKLDKVNKFVKPLLDEMYVDAESTSSNVTKVRQNLCQFYENVTLAKNHFIRTQNYLNSLRNASMGEIMDRHFQIMKSDKEVKKLFSGITSKSKEIVDLKIAITAIEVTSLTASLIPGIGFIATAAIMVASIALQAAAGKLGTDIETMTKKYIDDLKNLNDMKLDLDLIDIDIEKIKHYETKFKQIDTYLRRTEANKLENLPLWEKVVLGLGDLVSVVAVAREVMKKGLVHYTEIDISNIRGLWTDIEASAGAFY